MVPQFLLPLYNVVSIGFVCYDFKMVVASLIVLRITINTSIRKWCTNSIYNGIVAVGIQFLDKEKIMTMMLQLKLVINFVIV